MSYQTSTGIVFSHKENNEGKKINEQVFFVVVVVFDFAGEKCSD